MGDIGLRITAMRKARKISKSALARAIGVSPTAISKLESGETAMPRADHLLRIAAELGADPVVLVFGEDSEDYRKVMSQLPETNADRQADLAVKQRRLLATIIHAFVEECSRQAGETA